MKTARLSPSPVRRRGTSPSLAVAASVLLACGFESGPCAYDINYPVVVLRDSATHDPVCNATVAVRFWNAANYHGYGPVVDDAGESTTVIADASWDAAVASQGGWIGDPDASGDDAEIFVVTSSGTPCTYPLVPPGGWPYLGQAIASFDLLITSPGYELREVTHIPADTTVNVGCAHSCPGMTTASADTTAISFDLVPQ